MMEEQAIERYKKITVLASLKLFDSYRTSTRKKGCSCTNITKT